MRRRRGRRGGVRNWVDNVSLSVFECGRGRGERGGVINRRESVLNFIKTNVSSDNKILLPS